MQPSQAQTVIDNISCLDLWFVFFFGFHMKTSYNIFDCWTFVLWGCEFFKICDKKHNDMTKTTAVYLFAGFSNWGSTLLVIWTNSTLNFWTMSENLKSTSAGGTCSTLLQLVNSAARFRYRRSKNFSESLSCTWRISTYFNEREYWIIISMLKLSNFSN